MNSQGGITIASWPGPGGDMNPFIDLFCGGLEQQGCRVTALERPPSREIPQASAIVIHWPQFIYSDAFGYLDKARRLAQLIAYFSRLRRKGVRIVWLCHDLSPHDRDALKWKLLWWPTLHTLLYMADGIITLSPGTRDVVAQQYSAWIRGRLSWAWHPAYPGVKGSEKEREDTRHRYQIGEHSRVIGFFGQLRAQKGVDQLIRAFSATSDTRLQLLLGGPPMKTAAETSDLVKRAPEHDVRIHVEARKLSDDELRQLVAGCDVCIFPYKQYTHSGAMVYSLSAHRPLLAPRTPFSQSLHDVLPEWVTLYDGELTPEILSQFAQRDLPNGEPDLSAFTTAKLAQRVLELVTETGPIVTSG